MEVPMPSSSVQNMAGYRTRIGYSNASYTTDEERVVFEYMDKRGPLTIKSGTIVTENVLIVFLGPGQSKDPLRDDSEISMVRYLLRDTLEYNKTHPHSEAQPKGPRTLTLVYGPNLKWRPTTSSIELQDILETLQCKMVKRVEMCRSFSCKTIQYLLGEEAYPVTSLILGNTAMVQYRDLVTNITKVSPKDWIMPSTKQNEPMFPDPIAIAVMDPRGPETPSISSQVQINAKNSSYGNTIIAPTVAVDWASVFPHKPMSTHVAGIANTHSTISFMQQQLENLRFQKGLFPGSHILAACIGMYATVPLFRERGSRLLYHKQIHYHMDSQIQTYGSCHIPIICGFLCPISTEYCQISIPRPLVYTGHLAVTSKSDAVFTRYIHPQYIVSLGPFVPSTVNDTIPFQYSESAVHFNKIQQTLDTFNQMMGAAVISRSARAVGSSPVADHLFKLLHGTGATIFMSALPRYVTRRIRDSSGNKQDEVTRQFLKTYPPTIFLVVKNNKAMTKSNTVHFPIRVMRKAAELARCPISVFGITQRTPGLHFIDDTDNPVDIENIPPGKEFTPSFTIQPGDIYHSVHQMDEPDLIAVSTRSKQTIDWNMFQLESIVPQILRHPTVGSKEFIVRHMDRCGNGLVAQQPGVGPLDLPLSDYGLVFDSALWPMAKLTSNGEVTQSQPMTADVWNEITYENMLSRAKPYNVSDFRGNVVALGEQALKVILNPTNGAKLAITESLTNMMFAPKTELEDVNLSLSITWNNDPSAQNELNTVLHNCKDFSKELGVSMTISSASCSCPDEVSGAYSTIKSVVVTATTGVKNGPRVTPVLKQTGSILAHISIDQDPWLAGTAFEHIVETNADVVREPSPTKVSALFKLIQGLVKDGKILSGHDISDGGLVTCLIEMALAGNRGINVNIPTNTHAVVAMCSETPGAVIEVPEKALDYIKASCVKHGLTFRPLGKVGESGQNKTVTITQGGVALFNQPLSLLYTNWSSFSNEQYSRFRHEIEDGGLYVNDYGDNEISLGTLEKKLKLDHVCFYTQPDQRFQVAVLCPPGAGCETSMLSAMTNAGFAAYRINITEIQGINVLDQFIGIAISKTSGHKDNIAGSRGLALSCTRSDTLRGALLRFFRRPHTFSLGCGEFGFELLKSLGIIGITNGTYTGLSDQSISNSRLDLERNASWMYESRWVNVQVSEETKSIMMKPLAGTILPCWVQGTHLGIRYHKDQLEYELQSAGLVACTYHGKTHNESDYAKYYPRNPTANSTVAGICSPDGRHLALFFDPSLVFHMWQWQHIPQAHENLKVSPWSLMFFYMHIWCRENVPL